MTTPLRIELGEYERKRTAAPPPTTADEALAARLDGAGEDAGRLDVRWLANGEMEVQATSWVGVVRFSGVEVHVVPKLVGGSLRVLQMLQYAAGIRILRRLPADRMLAPSGTDLFDLICLLLVEESKALLQEGLLRDYRQIDESLEVLRGRLRHREQYLRRFGRLDRLECSFDEFDSDIAENQLVAAALAVVRRRAQDADVRPAGGRLARVFEEACEPRTSDASWYERTIRYDRRNDRYRPAHELAKLVLRGVAFDDLYDTTTGRVTAFLIDMNVVFELFVTRLVQEALAGTESVALAQERFGAVIRNDDTGQTYASIRPDIVVRQVGTAHCVPIDVKYKLYDMRKLSSGDLYQTFLYALALSAEGDRRAGIIFPSTGQPARTAIVIRPLSGPTAARIVAAGLDVQTTLENLRTDRDSLLEGVRALLDRLLQAPGSAVSAH